MGSRSVLDNIRYFLLHLLPRAEAGAPWTESDLHSALSWADYCQQAAAAAAGTPAEPVLARFVAAATGGARPELDVALLRQSRRALLSRLLQNCRAGDAVLRRSLRELRTAGELDSLLASQAAQKQAYCAVTAALRRCGGRRRLQALALRRYLLEGVLAGRQSGWLREKAAELAAGPDGPRMVALALATASPGAGGRDAVLTAVDAALERQLAAAGPGWTDRLAEAELTALLSRPALVTALEAACDRLGTAGEDSGGTGDTALLLRAAGCDRSGRVRRRLRAALRRRGGAGRAERVSLAARLPRFRLRDPTEEPGLDRPL